MFRSFKQRALEPEVMDDFTDGGHELREALGQIRRLNRIFAAPGPVLYGVRKLWKDAGKPRRFTILDIGSGSGDVNKALLRWAEEEGLELSIILSDITEEACEEARLLYRGEPRIRVRRSDVFDLPEASADIITASQFLHHFPEEELPKVVGHMLAASRLGVVISDLHRHWMPWLAVSVMVRLISANRFVKTDGPLSVAKGFRGRDWRKLRAALEAEAAAGAGTGTEIDTGTSMGAETKDFVYSWRPMFRYAAVIRRKNSRTNPVE
ncbi:methyltransferase domain-containing protein [Paenibacillus pinistramenti]|uniref:methyltransferase domain-containing protein n=1 Tax=Paenibacillus pinistramenti TaxID=1768003 RepID=UPI0011089D40|nr:methyltransferase domain-containing protein [Paenibacillus pinistramenti]